MADITLQDKFETVFDNCGLADILVGNLPRPAVVDHF